MGCDLIGYIGKMPVRLPSRKSVKKTVKVLQEALEELKKAWLAAEEKDDEKAHEEANEVFCKAVSGWGLNGKDIIAELDNACEDGVEHFFPDTDLEPILNRFYHWHKKGDRDTSMRVDPDNKRLLIFFTGQGSWGDTPENEGYELMEAMGKTGLTQLMGVR